MFQKNELIDQNNSLQDQVDKLIKENEALKCKNLEIDKAITLEYKYNNVVQSTR